MTTSVSAELFLAYIPKDDGTVNVLGIVNTYAAGTTTPKATYPTYADALAGTNANSTTINLDATGVVYFWMQGSYKIDIQTSLGASLSGWPKDNIQGAYLTQGAADLVYASINKPIQLLTSTYNAGTGVYSLTPSPAITSYSHGMRFTFIAYTTNSFAGATQVNISGLGNKFVSDLSGGDYTTKGSIRGGQLVEMVYDANDSVFRIFGAVPVMFFIEAVSSATWNLPTDGAFQKFAVTCAAYPNMFFEVIAADPGYGEWQTVDWGAGTTTYVRAEQSAGQITLKQRIITITVGSGSAVDSSLTIANGFQLMVP
jgi:hypothetical protein